MVTGYQIAKHKYQEPLSGPDFMVWSRINWEELFEVGEDSYFFLRKPRDVRYLTSSWSCHLPCYWGEEKYEIEPHQQFLRGWNEITSKIGPSTWKRVSYLEKIIDSLIDAPNDQIIIYADSKKETYLFYSSIDDEEKIIMGAIKVQSHGLDYILLGQSYGQVYIETTFFHYTDTNLISPKIGLIDINAKNIRKSLIYYYQKILFDTEK